MEDEAIMSYNIVYRSTRKVVGFIRLTPRIIKYIKKIHGISILNNFSVNKDGLIGVDGEIFTDPSTGKVIEVDGM